MIFRLKQFIFLFLFLCVFLYSFPSAAEKVFPSISTESEVYETPYFSLSIPKGWTVKEVYGHEDIPPGQDGFIVFYNNIGENVDIFSITIYDPHFPQYNIVFSVESLTELIKLNPDKSINTFFLKRYFSQQDFTNFQSHDGPTTIAGQEGYESVLEVANEEGKYLTYVGKRIDADQYAYVIEHYQYNSYDEDIKTRIDAVINSFKIKGAPLTVVPVIAMSAEDYYNRGVDYRIKGNLKEALADFNKSLELNTNFSPAYNNRAGLYYKMGDFSKALADYNKAVEINPSYGKAYKNRAVIHYKLKEFELAQSDLKKAESLGVEADAAFYNKIKSEISGTKAEMELVNKLKAEEYYNKGIDEANQGNLEQAMVSFNDAIKMNPNFALAYNNRGVVYYKQGNMDQAMADFKKAVNINRNYFQAYGNLGKVYAKKKDFAEAIQQYSQAIMINKNFSKAYVLRAFLYYEQGDYLRAKEDYTQAIKINPKYVKSYKNRAFVFYQLKEYDSAWADIQKAQVLGGSVDPELINKLKKASGLDQ